MTTQTVRHLATRFEQAYTVAADALAAARGALLESEVRGDANDKARAMNDRRRLVDGIVHSLDTMERIEQARRRVKAGTFGTCVDCGTEIPQSRLAALPWSERCVPCQDAIERREKAIQ